MYYQNDWLMRQIEIVIQAAARLLFNKDGFEYDFKDDGLQTGSSMLLRRLSDLADSGNIGKAEDILFESLDFSDESSLPVALAFYQKLNSMDDSRLQQGGFSREERSGTGLRISCVNLISVFRRIYKRQTLKSLPFIYYCTVYGTKTQNV